MTVYEITDNFPFELLSLSSPNAQQGGGSYFTNISIEDKPLYIQFPTCNLKNGIIETQRHKYCDLQYNIKNIDITNWIEKLESTCKSLLNEKKKLWFSGDLTEKDLNNMMSSLIRLFSANTIQLIRIYIDGNKDGTIKCRFFDENKNLASMNNINDNNTSLIPLIHIEGIRFTSKSFDIILKLKQLMIVNDILNENDEIDCLIKCNIQHNEWKPVKIELNEENLEEVDNNEENLEEVDNSEENLEEVDNSEENLEEVVNNEENLEEVVNNEDITLDLDIENINNIKNNDIKEVEIEITDDNPLHLRKPNEVYYELYNAAKEKAKNLRKLAIEAYLEAKNIKSKYLLDEIDIEDEINNEDEMENDELF